MKSFRRHQLTYHTCKFQFGFVIVDNLFLSTKINFTSSITFIKQNNLKALIIDDEIDICYLLSGILKQKNCQTRYVNNLKDAVVELKNSSPIIVFLDNHLPDGLGIEFVDHIKKNYPATKIIMITAFDTIADRQQAISMGVDIFIGKPFTKEAINSAIEELIS